MLSFVMISLIRKNLSSCEVISFHQSMNNASEWARSITYLCQISIITVQLTPAYFDLVVIIRMARNCVDGDMVGD